MIIFKHACDILFITCLNQAFYHLHNSLDNLEVTIFHLHVWMAK